MATWMKRTWRCATTMGHLRGRFTSAYVGGNVTAVNTQLYGDQYSPKSVVRVQPLGCLTAWARTVHAKVSMAVISTTTGTVSGNEFLVNTTVFGSQMHRFWVPTAQDFTRGMSGFGLNSRLDYTGKSILIPPARRWDE